MAKKKITRKELLKGSDEFLTLSAKVAEFFRARLHQLKVAGLVVLIAAAVYIASQMYFRHVNEEGQVAYDAAYELLGQNLKPETPAGNWKKAADGFEKVISDYGLSSVARLALPQVAFIDFLDKKYDEAIKSYRKFSGEFSQGSQYQSLNDLALAACYEAKGDLKVAIETLNAILKRPGDVYQQSAMFNLARLYRIDHQPEKAKKISQEYIEKYKDSPFLPLVKAYL
jgi:outer membrane protein assembly factor BamD (BamD/ComL family)